MQIDKLFEATYKVGDEIKLYKVHPSETSKEARGTTASDRVPRGSYELG